MGSARRQEAGVPKFWAGRKGKTGFRPQARNLQPRLPDGNLFALGLAGEAQGNRMPTLTVTETEDQLIITVEDARIDAAIATRFKDRLREIVLRVRKPVRMDMRHVDFMDSSGLGAMIAVRKALPESLPLVLDGLTPNVERVFRLTRMDSVFQIGSASAP